MHSIAVHRKGNSSKPPGSRAGVRVLLLDDRVDDRVLLRRFLEKKLFASFELYVTELEVTGLAAMPEVMKQLADSRFDIVFSDLMWSPGLAYERFALFNEWGKLAPGTRPRLVVWSSALPLRLPYHQGIEDVLFMEKPLPRSDIERLRNFIVPAIRSEG